MKFIHICHTWNTLDKASSGLYVTYLYNRKQDTFQVGEYLQHLVLYKNSRQQYAEYT